MTTWVLIKSDREPVFTQQEFSHQFFDRYSRQRFIKVLGCCLLLLLVLLLSNNANAQRSTEDKAVSELFQSFTQKNNNANVLGALLAGEVDASTPFNNFYTEQHLNHYRKLQQSYLAQAKAFQKKHLSPQSQVNLDVFIEQRKNTLNEIDRPAYELAVWQSNDYLSGLFFISSGYGRLSFDKIKDYEQWFERLQQFPALVNQLKVSFQKDLDKDVIAPAALVNHLAGILNSNAPQSIENSVFYQPVTNMPSYFTANQKQYVIMRYSKVIKQSIYPAIDQLKDLLINQYLSKSQGIKSVTSSDQGKDWYSNRLATYIGDSIEPDELHQAAHSNIKQIKQGLLEIQKQSGKQGTLSEFIQHMNDTAYFFQHAETLMKNYRQAMHQINKQTPSLFSDFPKATYQLASIDEVNAAKSPALYYQLKTVEELMIGTLNINSARRLLHPKWQVKAHLLKYGAPGYHFLHAMHSELNDLPVFRDSANTRAFELGWGLYTASLGDELKVYSSWKDRLGWLLMDLKATLLLAVDTGIHLKGWSANDANDYLMQHGFFTEQQASSITHKIMLRPGLWSAEKAGFIMVMHLKQQAIKQLGASFNPKHFHQQLLQNGRLPIAVVEKNVKQWIGNAAKDAVATKNVVNTE